jgi:hypothetical protein
VRGSTSVQGAFIADSPSGFQRTVQNSAPKHPMSRKDGGSLDLRENLGNRMRSASGFAGTKAGRKTLVYNNLALEAPPGFEPGIEVLQTSALPLGYGAEGETARHGATRRTLLPVGPWVCLMGLDPLGPIRSTEVQLCAGAGNRKEDGAGNGIRTRDFDLGKVALYH